MNNTQKVLIAAVAGAIVGVLAGILIAPDKGSETRKKIADQSRKVTDQVKEAATRGKSAVSGMREKLFNKKHEDSFAENMAENRVG